MTRPKRAKARDLLKALAPTLVLLRRVKGVSQQAVAERAGLDRSNLSRIEHGRRIPCVPTLLRVLEATETNLAQLGGLLDHVWRLGSAPAPPNPREMGRILRYLRRRANKDHGQLARAAGVGQSTVWSLELALDSISTERLLQVVVGLDSTLEEVQLLNERGTSLEGEV